MLSLFRLRFEYLKRIIVILERDRFPRLADFLRPPQSNRSPTARSGIPLQRDSSRGTAMFEGSRCINNAYPVYRKMHIRTAPSRETP